MRSRLRWLERGKAEVERRLERLHHDLEASMPARAYNSLVEKHATLQAHYRKARA